MKQSYFRQLTKLVLLLQLFALFACATESKIVIISTNDIHGRIEAFPRLATLVKDVRNADSAAVLLIDAGDRWTGNPYNDLADQPGYPIIELMNMLGYNYATVGNHEFDNGQARLDERLSQGKFKTIVANMHNDGSEYLNFPPYAIFNVGKTKIALIGVVTNYENGHPDGNPAIYTGLNFTEPIAEATEYRYLRDSANVFIAVSHIGNDRDSLLAAAVPELDLIIGGHSHTLVAAPEKVGTTVITQTGSNLRYAGLTTLTMRGKKLVSIENRLVALDTMAAAPEYQKVVDGYLNNPKFKQVVGTAKSTFEKTAIMNLITNIIRETTKTDLAFYNVGGIRLKTIPQGNITYGDVFAMEPFNSTIYTHTMSPEQIKTLIVNKYNANNEPAGSIDLYPSGIDYEIVCDTKGFATDVRFIPSLTKSSYTVALSNYVTASYIFDFQGKGTPNDGMLTDMIMNYFKSHSPLVPDDTLRAWVEGKVTKQ